MIISLNQKNEPFLQSNIIKLKDLMTHHENNLIPSVEKCRKINLFQTLNQIFDDYKNNDIILYNLLWIIGQVCSGETIIAEQLISKEFIEKIISVLNKENEDILSIVP